MSSNLSLQRLNLVGAATAPPILAALGVSLEMGAPLARVALSRPFMSTYVRGDATTGAHAAARLASGVARSPTLRDLRLDGCLCAPDQAAALIALFRLSLSLTKVDLSGCCVTGAACAALSSFLAHPASPLRAMQLALNPAPACDLRVTPGVYAAMTDDDAAHIAAGLAANSWLAYLGLRMCGLSPAGITSLATAMATNTGLTALDVRQNSFDDGAACALARALDANASIRLLTVFTKHPYFEYMMWRPEMRRGMSPGATGVYPRLGGVAEAALRGAAKRRRVKLGAAPAAPAAAEEAEEAAEEEEAVVEEQEPQEEEEA